jgi:predicted ATPase
VITEVRAKNFKALRDVRVKLGPCTILAGPNASGKSTLIEVFRLLHRASFPTPGLHGLSNAFPGGFHEFTWKGGASNLIELELLGDFTGSTIGPWDYRLQIAGDERGSIRMQTESLLVTDSQGSHELISSAEGHRQLKSPDGHVVVNVLDSTRCATEFDIEWQGAWLRQYMSRWRFYRLVPPLLKQVNQVAAPTFLTELGDNLSAWLMLLQTRYPEAFARIRQIGLDVFPELEELFTWPTQQATVMVAAREKHLKRPVSIWHMADGQLAFLALVSLIYAPVELSGLLYCIEEPENHLHPRLLEVLAELLRQALEDPDRQAAQVIISTHSPIVIDQFSLEDLVVVDRAQGETHITKPGDRRHLRDLLERAESGLGQLYYTGALG